MKLYKIALCLLLLTVLSCNIKQNSNTSFLAYEFVEINKGLSEDELTIKLDSVLINNQYLTTNEKAHIFFEKGRNHSKAYSDKKAKENYSKALKLFETADNVNYITKSLINLSNANIYLKNYSDANAQAIEALDLAKANSNNKLIASANNTISNIYYINKDYEKSLEYLNNSVALQIREKDSINLSLSYNNIAILYKKTNNIEKSIQYNQKSLEISKRIKDSVGIGKTYSNLGRLYIKINKFDKGLEFYKKAIKNNDEFNISNNIPYANIGTLFIDLKRLDSASVFFLKAIKKENIKRDPEQLHLIYEDLLLIAKKQDRPFDIVKYQKKKDSLKYLIDAQQNKEKLKALNRQQKQFKTEKENAQIKLINNRNRVLFISILTILLLLGIIFYQKNRNRKLKYNEEKKSLELKVLRSQMNPHFIFNALSSIQNSILDNDQITSAKYLSRFAKLIRQNFDFTNHKTIPLIDEIDALKNYLDTQQMRFKNKFEYAIKVSKNININLIEIPPLLLQPFIENAIEHGFKAKKEKGIITINISKNNNKLSFKITDNGNGITQSKNKTKTHSTDIFLKRLKLLGNKDEQSFSINSSNKGTIINFSLKQ